MITGMPISILHVCPRPSFSGLEAYALEMATFQARAGCHITFVVLEGSPLDEKCHKAGLPTITVDQDFMGRIDLLTRLTLLLRSDEKPDIIHLHSTQDLDLLMVPLALSRLKANRPRVVLQTHIWISHSKRDPLHAISYSLVDEVWTSSGPAKAALEKYLPIASGKIRIINYGRDVKTMAASFLSRAEARAFLKLPLEAIVVGTVSRVDEGKGTRELFHGVLPHLRSNPALHLILIGPATADDPKAVAYAESLNQDVEALPPEMRSRVHVLGQLPESYRYLKAFDLFVLATYKENFALSLLEALLAGVPALATKSGGSPEVVRDGETGWLFEPRSAESLSEAISRALVNRDDWSRLGAQGQARIRREFDTEKCLPATIAAYHEILF